MNPSLDNVDLELNRPEVAKDEDASYHCDLCDADKIYKLAQELLPGLASACVDNTIGGLFKSPGSVAIDIRREMVDYLIQRSETFVAETVVLDNGTDEIVYADPHDIISDFVDDFASSKRNFVSRVSGWLLSDRREDRIDDFVQEMEINGFWLLNRRESVAQTLLRNVDFRNLYHCDEKFKSREDLEEHRQWCGFRTVICTNEGCNARFSAAQLDRHDSLCPFKILSCEQKCSASIMRREMDRHCITVCPMKLVKCPFFSVGCYSSVPQCKIDVHRKENLGSHVLYGLRAIHKEASEEDIKERVELLMVSFLEQLEAVRDARSLTFKIKDLDARLGPMKANSTTKSDDNEIKDSCNKDEVTTPAKKVTFKESREIKRENSISSSASSDNGESAESQNIAEQKLQSQHNDKEFLTSNSMQESPRQREDDLGLPIKAELQMEKKSDDEAIEANEHENISSPLKAEEKMNSVASTEELIDEVAENHDIKSNTSSESESNEHENMRSTIEGEEKISSVTKTEEYIDEVADNRGIKSKTSSEFEVVEQENIRSPIEVEEKMNSVTNSEKHIDEVDENHAIKSNASSESEAAEDEHIISPIKVKEKMIANTEEHIDEVSKNHDVDSNTSSESEK